MLLSTWTKLDSEGHALAEVHGFCRQRKAVGDIKGLPHPRVLDFGVAGTVFNVR